jgi:ribosomal protein S18 acetylase RimI-like enzyme
MEIRRAEETDWPRIWQIFRMVVNAGNVFSYDTDTSEDVARELWVLSPAVAYTVWEDGVIVGTYMIRPNQPGRGSHVANAGFMVDAHKFGRGIGRAMGEHALQQARELGYTAMQFNFVVSTNTHAVELWKSLGFSILGTVPNAFQHCEKGLVAVYVMYREL